MSGRPEVLFPLFATLDVLPGIGPRSLDAFAQLGVTRPRDLALTLPSGGLARRRIADLSDLHPPETVLTVLTVSAHHPATGRGRPFRVVMTDGTQDLTLVFFRAKMEWIAAQLPLGAKRLVSGKVEIFDGRFQIVHPDIISDPGDARPADFEPIYPLSEGLTQKLVRRSMAGALALLPDLDEWADPGIIHERGWPDWRQSLHLAHHPQGPQDLTAEAPARARLAYDELFAHQVTLALIRRDRRRIPGRSSRSSGARRAAVLAALPFTPTNAQLRVLSEIEADMAAPERMNRLVQGDVGAGKTLVAFLAMLTAIDAGGQAVLMAPTSLLARQHLRALQPLAEAARVRLGLLTGRDPAASQRATREAVAGGHIDILVGTHAVFQESVDFADLRLAVIDEQHRFGVAERLKLAAKGVSDMLVMTATPIPRSLAMTHYGDLDVSILDEKPPGRQPITTVSLPEDRVPEVIDRLEAALARGTRAYWVCPLVEESEQVDLTSADERFTMLRARFGDAVRLMHGQMPTDQRDAAMADFATGRAQILVATTVIEVGVDVPEATIMVVEHSENFGLAQLHQLRGRVGRGSEASTCILLYRPPLGETGRRRLAILRETEDGFRIAEEDLAIRGAGDVLGTAQSGLPQFRIADLERQPGLMALARKDAQAFLASDPLMETQRGHAVRVLLWFMEQDKAIRLIAAG